MTINLALDPEETRAINAAYHQKMKANFSTTDIQVVSRLSDLLFKSALLAAETGKQKPLSWS
jgi:cob(I)alamin adenosyltransferase